MRVARGTWQRSVGGRAGLALLAVIALTSVAAPAGDATSCAPSGCGPQCRGNLVTIDGTSGSDRLVGTKHSDVMAGEKGDDRVFGRGGHDLICGGPGDDLVDGGGENDGQIANCPDCAQAFPPPAGLFGGRGRDLIAGGAGNDDLFGGRSADNLGGQAGTDLCVGGRPREDRFPRADVANETCEMAHGVR